MTQQAKGQQSAAAPPVSTVQEPPRTWAGIFRRLGPGLIIAASIVGSGELIGTTKTGAEAGFWLLWLIVLGCVIKVFVQVEFGRFAIAEGRTSMEGLDQVPGPRLRVSWLVWYWVLMFGVGLGQLGGIVGGVGQSLAITFPMTGDVRATADIQESQNRWDAARRDHLDSAGIARSGQQAGAAADEALAQAEAEFRSLFGPRPELPFTYDDLYWSWIVTLVTAFMLYHGRYALIQSVATVLVAGFTAVTVFNVFALESHEAWSIGWKDLRDGMSFRLPPSLAGQTISPVATALATFGIIGVGASELVAYPYWCLERGYARYTGPRDASTAWAERARGWLRVLRCDAWCSMLIYTFATLAFYLLGAAVLWRQNRHLADNQIVYTLSQMYVPVFGGWAGPVFLLGAFAVLYSTFFVATAGNARIASDALRVFGVAARTEHDRLWWVRTLSAVFPFLSVSIYTVVKDPVGLVLLSGMIQSIMLPMLGGAGLYFRYRRCDPRVTPGKLWDGMLWISCLGLLVAGTWGAASSAAKAWKLLAALAGG